MKIGFYGDSFCCEVYNVHSVTNGYDTYIKKLKNHYNAEIINLGIGGSSIWDVILKQFDINNIPDICIFCWTNPDRIYHKNVRNITLGNVENKKIKDFTLQDFFYRKTISAAKQYFEYLHDFEKSRLEYLSALQYFDNNVLTNIKSKIIHLWSFESYYQWKNGKTIDIPLSSFVIKDTLAANHLDGENVNEQVFQLIKSNLD